MKSSALQARDRKAGRDAADPTMAQAPLFPDLPLQRTPLDSDGLAFLGTLPEWPTTRQIGPDEEPVCRRMEALGYVRVERCKADPIAIRRTSYAGITGDGWEVVTPA